MNKQESLERMAGETLAQNNRIAALDGALTDIVRSWDSLRMGDYPRDVIETWLMFKMKPAIERARKTLGR
jgi:hypothetical protein